MIFHLCRETVSHTTDEFPMAYYRVDKSHPRYHMIHHWHPEAEWLIVREGEIRLTLDGVCKTLRRGQVVLIPPGTVHSGIPDRCIYECVVFDPTILQSPLRGSAGKAVKKFLSRVSIYDTDKDDALNRLTACLQTRAPGFETEALAASFDRINRLIYKSSQPEIVTPDRKQRLIPFENAVLYLQEHYPEPVGLSDLAAAAGLSENYFGEYFKTVTGKTPIQYLTEYRVERAAEALRGNDASVTEIALECGFNDLSYFIKTFRRFYGTSPAQYRKNVNR